MKSNFESEKLACGKTWYDALIQVREEGNVVRESNGILQDI